MGCRGILSSNKDVPSFSYLYDIDVIDVEKDRNKPLERSPGDG